ncbi:MAG: adenylate/guanylate cyclase domain-containing protein [Proteobacteria bacterium]|nr:adenylate/guanylate cyclase domain-containing protein [Pseudomonadota bacterium]
MEGTGVKRKLAVILAADVAGYSRLMGADEEATLKTLGAYREIIDGTIARHDGRIFSTAGDSVVAEFASPVEAVRAAISIQEELSVRNAGLADERKMHLRIGINLGDVMVQGENLLGDGVNVAARLEGLADPGGICISGDVYNQIETKLALGYDDLGFQDVKNIARPVRAYRVVVEPGPGAVTVPGLQPQRSPVTDKPSIAVLPFVNMSADPEQEYFSDGITEDLITDLSKISGLFVVSRNAVFLYKGKAVEPQRVSQELGVRYVLEGSVRKAGDRVRISAQLIDPPTGYHLWAERYDRDLTDIFALQDEITEKIVAALEVKLTEGEQEQVARRYTDNLEAYDYFLRGRAYQARATKETNVQAREMFERAIELDPSFAGAYAVLSHTHWRDWSFQWSEDPQALERAFEAAKRAVALDDSLPLAHTYLGWAYVFRKQYEEAIAEGERAIVLDPNFAEGYARLGHILSLAGRPQEAVDSVKKAMRLDPHYRHSYLYFLGHAYYAMEKYEEAIAALKKGVTRNPDLMVSHLLLAVIYSELGRKEEAQAEVAETLRISPRASMEGQRERMPFKDQAVLERFIDGLRKAGLPEKSGSTAL